MTIVELVVLVVLFEGIVLQSGVAPMVKVTDKFVGCLFSLVVACGFPPLHQTEKVFKLLVSCVCAFLSTVRTIIAARFVV